jgi:hypothetical protein
MPTTWPLSLIAVAAELVSPGSGDSPSIRAVFRAPDGRPELEDLRGDAGCVMGAVLGPSDDLAAVVRSEV